MQFISFLSKFALSFLFLLSITCSENPLSLKSVWVGGCNYHSDQGFVTTYNSISRVRDRIAMGLWSYNKALILFGGKNYNLYSNDLYKSNDDGNTFYWIGGCRNPNLGNYTYYNGYGWPAARTIPSTFMINGTGYLFGGAGQNIAWNDLWIFDTNYITTDSPNHHKIFRWIAGCDNAGNMGNYTSPYEYGANQYPMARHGNSYWVHNGKFYIFGGKSQYGYLNDVFEFDPITVTFRWLSGCNGPWDTSAYYPPSYNMEGIPSSRTDCLSFVSPITDSAYLFSGSSKSDSGKYFNDLWKSNDDGRTWYWIAGCNSFFDPGNDDPFYPSARYGSTAVILNNLIYIIGGFSHSTKATGYLNDIFSFDGTNFDLLNGIDNKGTHINKKTIVTKYGESSLIGSRYWHSSIAHDDRIIVVGGYGYDINSTGYLNDIHHIYFMKDTNSSIVFLSIFEWSLIGVCTFSVIIYNIFAFFKSSLFYSSKIIHDKSYLVLILLGIINFFMDILMIIYFMEPFILIYFIATICLLFLSILFNYFFIFKWIKYVNILKNSENEILNFLNTYNSIFHILSKLSILINPSLLLILKSNFSSFTRFPIVTTREGSITHLSIFHDVYSVIPFSVLICFHSFSYTSYHNWTNTLWVMLFLKFIILISSFTRIFWIIFFGGGKWHIQKQLKYGVYPTIKTKRELISESNDSFSSTLDSNDNSPLEISVISSKEFSSSFDRSEETSSGNLEKNS